MIKSGMKNFERFKIVGIGLKESSGRRGLIKYGIDSGNNVSGMRYLSRGNHKSLNQGMSFGMEHSGELRGEFANEDSRGSMESSFEGMRRKMKDEFLGYDVNTLTPKQLQKLAAQKGLDKKYSKLWGWNEEKGSLERMIRVDYAGEFGACTICEAQNNVLKNDPVIEEIYEQEKEHFQKFDELVKERRVRPTILKPVWTVAGYSLGTVTALMGREAAMACHEAVEAVISEHYNDQLRELRESEMKEYGVDYNDSEKMDNLSEEDYYFGKHNLEKIRKETEDAIREQQVSEPLNSKESPIHEEKKQQNSDSDKLEDDELRDTIRRFRDDEMHHHELAQENQANRAPFYQIMYQSIVFGCKTAIFLTKRF